MLLRYLKKIFYNSVAELRIYKEYAYYYYLSDLYQNKLKEISRTAQAGFNSTDFNDMYFPLPPFTEQKRIVAKIRKVFSVFDNIQKVLEV